VDDREDDRVVMKEYLSGYDLIIDEAESAEKALEILKDSVPDLIIMDQRLPGMSGYEAVQAVYQSDHVQNVPIIVCSAKSFIPEADEFKKLGVKAFLRKPFWDNELVRILEENIGKLDKK